MAVHEATSYKHKSKHINNIKQQQYIHNIYLLYIYIYILLYYIKFIFYYIYIYVVYIVYIYHVFCFPKIVETFLQSVPQCEIQLAISIYIVLS